jgi:hypothetical protein
MAGSNYGNRLSRERLEKTFAALGVDDPASWADSEIDEDIPQLAILLFLRAAWRLVIDETHDRWIDSQIENGSRRPADPYSGVGQALQRLLASGAQRQDIVDVVRGMQAELLFSILYLTADSGQIRDVVPASAWSEVQHIDWALFEVDANGSGKRPLSGLHESVLMTDPTGREMRPRGASIAG